MYDDTIHDNKQESFVRNAIQQMDIKGALMGLMPANVIQSLLAKAINIGYNYANVNGAKSVEELVSKFKEDVKSFNPKAKVTVRLEY